jgi:hypothetical protein
LDELFKALSWLTPRLRYGLLNAQSIVVKS